jgi:hypothetical protein
MKSNGPVRRQDIEFTTSDSTVLRGWLYMPGETTRTVPGIVMTHGFSAVKEMQLDQYAVQFAAAGFAVLVYDHRNTGSSDGSPRKEINPWQQIRDYRDAISCLSVQGAVDRDRIGIWGTSYSGGHVLEVGALDNRVKCIVSQVPIINGLESAKRIISDRLLQKLKRKFNHDRLARFTGEMPAMIPVVCPPGDNGGLCVLPGDDAWSWFSRSLIIPGCNWNNEVTLRSLEMLYEYVPGKSAVAQQAPLLMIVANDDQLAVPDLAMDAFAEIPGSKQLVQLDGGHFAVYDELFQRSVQAALEWFSSMLGRFPPSRAG